MSRAQKIQFRHQSFWAIALTLFMVAYNVSVMPAIMSLLARELNASVGSIQGILVVFSLTTASFAPTTENLCRFYGRTRVFSIGLTLYGIGIALTSLSPSIGILAISFSLLTGLAATPLISTPWAIAELMYGGEAEEQTNLVLILASVLGGLSGGIVGGFIAYHLGWRWAFAPSITVLILVSRFKRSLPNQIIPSPQAIDWVGGLLSFLGLSSIFAGIGLAGEFGWWEPKREFAIGSMIIPPFAISIVPTLVAVGMILLGFFGYWQRRQASRSGASLFQVGLLRRRGFVFGMFAAMVHTLIVTGIQFNLFQFLPLALSLNPFRTALAIMPYNLTMPIVLVTVVKYLSLGSRITPKYIVCSGIALLAAGIGILYISLHPQVKPLELVPALIIMGIGSGLFLSYISVLTFSEASVKDKPQCPGIYNPVQNLGSSLGRAILGTSLVFFTSQGVVDGVLQKLDKTLPTLQRIEVTAKLQEILQTFSQAEIRTTLANEVPLSVLPSLRSINLDAATIGIRNSLLVALILTVICFVLAIGLPKYPSCRSS